jgi:hypothetical protein
MAGRELFRVHPQVGPEGYKTYQISAPRSTHTRPATCAEVDCQGWRHGWITRVPVGSELAEYITGKVHGRHFTETTGLGSPDREFVFPPGQECFRSSQHRVPLEREPVYLVRDGDYRGNPRGTGPVTRTAIDWVDDFATHQQQLADRRQRG